MTQAPDLCHCGSHATMWIGPDAGDLRIICGKCRNRLDAESGETEDDIVVHWNDLQRCSRKAAATAALQAALVPFIAMAKACETLHDNEPISARAIPGNRVTALDARDFRTLARCAEEAARL